MKGVRADKPAGPTIRPSVYGEVAYSPDQTKILIPVMHGHSVYDSMTGEQLASPTPTPIRARNSDQ